MARKLRELVEKAADDIGYLRYPDISEAKARLDEIIVAAGLGGISHDEVVGLEVDDVQVVVHTRYSVRSCEQTDRYQFPAILLDARDPVRAAKAWGLEEKRTECVSKRDEASRSLAHYEAKIADIDAQLAALRT